MATLGETATYVSENLIDENNTAVSAAQVRKAINDAISYWKKRRLWFNEFEEDVTLTASTAAFSFSTNTPLYLFKNGGLVLTDNQHKYPLRKVASRIYDLEDNQSVGRPYIYTYRNGGFEVYFLPDDTYTVTGRGIKDYSAFATDGTDDSSTNDWLTNADVLIQHEATARLYLQQRQNREMAAIYSQSARDEYRELRKFNREKNETGFNQTDSLLII